MCTVILVYKQFKTNSKGIFAISSLLRISLKYVWRRWTNVSALVFSYLLRKNNIPIINKVTVEEEKFSREINFRGFRGRPNPRNNLYLHGAIREIFSL